MAGHTPRDAKPTAFMQAIRERRLQLAKTDASFTQEGVAGVLGVTFQTYSDYERGRVAISRSKAEQLLGLMVEEKDRDAYRGLDGFPIRGKTASEMLEPIAMRLFPGQKVLPLGELLHAVRSEREEIIAQSSFIGAVEGTAINNGTLDPGERRFKEMIGTLGYAGTDESIETFYREGCAAVERRGQRRDKFADALFVMRHFDAEHNTLYIPNRSPSEAVWTFTALSEALEAAGHPISNGHLKRFEMGTAVPNRGDAEAIAGIFGFTGETAEADMYAAAGRLRREHPAFPDKVVTSPSATVTLFGKRLKAIREILGLTQDDIPLLARDIPRGLIDSVENGERKTAMPAAMLDGIYRALGLADGKAFEEMAVAAQHVTDIRRQNFGAALKLWREEMLGNLTQDDFGLRVKAGYERLQQPEQYGAAFTSFVVDGQIGAWESGTVPSHPMMLKAVITATGAADEAQFFIDSGMREDEIRRDDFKKTEAYADQFYKALIARQQNDERLRGKLSMFADRQLEPRKPPRWAASRRANGNGGPEVS